MGNTDCSIETRVKKHYHHFWVHHLGKLDMVEHNTNLNYHIIINDTTLTLDLKMQTECSSKVLVYNHKTTRCNNPEEKIYITVLLMLLLSVVISSALFPCNWHPCCRQTNKFIYYCFLFKLDMILKH